MNIDGTYLEIIIEKKKIKNIYFRINEKKQIYVTCPKYVSKMEIEKVLKANKKALEKMYKKVEKKKINEDKVLLLGKELNYINYKKIMFENDLAFGPSIEDINNYLEKNSLATFEERLKIYKGEFRNLPKFRLRIRNMKTRWGVCNKKSMTITLNSKLIHKDPFLIDYVIVHELSHFEHMDHSNAFWRCVESHFPNYKKARKELKD